MANRLVVLHKEFGPLLNALGKRSAPPGHDSIINMSGNLRIEFGLDVANKSEFERLKNDRLLKKLLKTKTDSSFKTALKKIAMIVDKNTKDFHIKAKGVSPADLDRIKKRVLDTVWKNTQAELASFSKTANGIWNAELKHYYKNRQQGKREKSKERVKKVQAVGGAAGSLVGVGLATAGTVASLGAAAPGLAAATYGSYLACKDAFDVFRKSGKSIDARRDSILKQVDFLTAEYVDIENNEGKKAKHDKMRGRELKAKALNSFLSVNVVSSLKKLGGDLHALEKALKVSKFSLSKVGRESGKHIDRLDKVIEYCAKLEKSPQVFEMKKIAKAIKKEKLSNKIMGDTDKLKAEAIYQKKLAKQHIITTLESYDNIDKLQREAANWVAFVDELKKGRPKSVKRAGAIFKGMKIGFQVGAAAASMGTSSMSFVPKAAKFVIGSPGSLQEIGMTLVDTAKSIESEYSLAKKARDKIAKKVS